nr:PREDICTED: uncharacterized protein LOC108221526 [Daucus carota subsp. sativus]
MDSTTCSSQGTTSVCISNSHPGSSSTHSEFVNHGLLLWNEMRLSWTKSKRTGNQSKKQEPLRRWGATYGSLLEMNKRYHKPVPLSEMVEILADIWEQEGLFD